MFNFDLLKTVKAPEHRLAWLVAIMADALQIVPQRQAPWITSRLSSVYGLSCGRWK